MQKSFCMLRITFAAFLLCFISLFVSAASAEAYENVAQRNYENYIEVINAYEQAYGTPSSIVLAGMYCGRGLVYARLTDMNKDGVPELILCYNDSSSRDPYTFLQDYRTDIWTLRSSKPQLCVSKLPLYHSNGFSASLRFTEINGQTVYMENADNLYLTNYYGFNILDQLDCISTMEAEASGSYYKIDEIEVSREAYMSENNRRNQNAFGLEPVTQYDFTSSNQWNLTFVKDTLRRIGQLPKRTIIEDFTGYYYENLLPDSSRKASVPIMKLFFNEDGVLVKKNGMSFDTNGAVTFIDYSDYTISKNVLTAHCSRSYSYYGSLLDKQPESDSMTLLAKGILINGLDLYHEQNWQDLLLETSADSQLLPEVVTLDFSNGDYSKKRPFLGIEDLKREQIGKITFLNTLENAPSDAWDVSEASDQSVLAWEDPDYNGTYKHIYIAADGGVIASERSDCLFRSCSNLEEVDFNGSFDTSNVFSFNGLFQNCRSLKKIEGLTLFNTRFVTAMKRMFLDCESLEELDLNSFDTSRTSDMSQMFEGCRNLKTLHIENFEYHANGKFTDMYKDTIWEGSSPILEDFSGARYISSYILDTQNLTPPDPALQYYALSAFDQILYDHYSSAEGSRKQSIKYAFCDLNADGLAEMLIKERKDSGTVCSAYTFIPAICKAASIPGFHALNNAKHLVLFPAEHLLGYYAEETESLNFFIYEDDKLCSTEGRLRPEDAAQIILSSPSESLHFFNMIPETDIQQEIDPDRSGQVHTLRLRAAQDKESRYAFASLSFDYDEIYSGSSEDGFSEASFDFMEFEDQNPLLVLNLGTISRIFQYKDGSWQDFFSLDDLFDCKKQFSGDDNAFHVSRPETLNGSPADPNALRFFFNVHSPTFDDLYFTLDYQYEENQLKQCTYIADRIVQDHIPSEWKLAADLNLYVRPFSSKTQCSLSKGTLTSPCVIAVFSKRVWMYLTSETGQSGWLPLGWDSIFTENAFTPSADQAVFINDTDSWFFKDAYLPENTLLKELGNQCLAQENYLHAILYYRLMHTFLDLPFTKPAELKTAVDKYKDACFETIEAALNDQKDYASAYRILKWDKRYLYKDPRYKTYMDLCQEKL